MTREELLAAAVPAHDLACNCDPRYRMSCPRMAAAILDLVRPTTDDTPLPGST